MPQTMLLLFDLSKLETLDSIRVWHQSNPNPKPEATLTLTRTQFST
jgi:hypothetical protein